MVRRCVLLLLGSLLVLPVGSMVFADESLPEPEIAEPFDGKLRLKWKILNPDAKHWSLAKNKSKLTITTQKGSMHQIDDKRAGKPKNLFLIGNPYGRSGDFSVSVCVSDFQPTQQFQQAGLLLYEDDDNYLKFVWEANGEKGEAKLVVVREVETKTEYVHGEVPANKGKVWLRLTRRKNEYESASSADGEKWTAHGKIASPRRGYVKIGIIAKNAGTDAPQIDACFTDFRARPVKRTE